MVELDAVSQKGIVEFQNLNLIKRNHPAAPYSTLVSSRKLNIVWKSLCSVAEKVQMFYTRASQFIPNHLHGRSSYHMKGLQHFPFVALG